MEEQQKAGSTLIPPPNLSSPTNPHPDSERRSSSPSATTTLPQPAECKPDSSSPPPSKPKAATETTNPEQQQARLKRPRIESNPDSVSDEAVVENPRKWSAYLFLLALLCLPSPCKLWIKPKPHVKVIGRSRTQFCMPYVEISCGFLIGWIGCMDAYFLFRLLNFELCCPFHPDIWKKKRKKKLSNLWQSQLIDK